MHEDVVTAGRSRLSFVVWAGLAVAVLIGGVVLTDAAEGSNADKARGCEHAVCVDPVDLVGPPGHLPTAAQLRAESRGAIIAASWTLGSSGSGSSGSGSSGSGSSDSGSSDSGSSDSGIAVPAAKAKDEYALYGACSGGGTMTAVVQLPTEQVSMTFDCDGHMGAGVDLPVGLLAADGGVSRDAGEPYRLAVTTTGNVSAGELFVLNHD